MLKLKSQFSKLIQILNVAGEGCRNKHVVQGLAEDSAVGPRSISFNAGLNPAGWLAGSSSILALALMLG